MTMKKLIIAAAAFMVAASTYGQGYFLFNARDTTFGNNINFQMNGAGVTGPDFFLEVLAGTSPTTLQPLAEKLPLNRTGTGVGYPNPFSATYTTALPAGTANIGYRAFQGTSWDTATVRSELITTVAGTTTPITVALVTAPTPPNEALLGVGNVALVPEPTTMALGLLGLGTLLVFRRRQ